MVKTEITETRLLADHLERSIQGGAWHGPATCEALAGIDASAAARRPVGFPHTIASLVRHISFWLDAAHARIGGGSSVDPRADWPEEEALTEVAWSQAIADLEQAYARLHSLVLELKDDQLDDAVPGCDPSVRGMLLGVLQHNAYHTGQIVKIAREFAT